MSPIDFLPRNLTRPVDAPTLRDASGGSEASEGNGLLPQEGFESLLECLTEQHQTEGGKAPLSESADALLPPAENDAGSEAMPNIAGSVFMLLEGFLPRVLPQSGSAALEGQDQLADGSPLLLLQDFQQSQDSPDLVRSPPRMLVSVQHQETHFRPVLEGSDTSASFENTQDGGVELNVPSSVSPKDSSTNLAGRGMQRQPNDPATNNPAVPSVVTASPGDEDAAVGEHIETQPFEKAEVLKSNSAEVAHADSQSLPPSTIHRLAQAMGAEIRVMTAEAALHSSRVGGTSPNISIKASESALRILNLQLHPAELGTVTIKMKLAGDTLEMELHVEKEETAQLLRHDTEKLSALLRGSGYRPDVISIQVADGTGQDRSSAPKMQADMQFQGQSFSQGGASQDERSRSRDKSYVSAGAEQHNNAGDDNTMRSHNRGGVYL